MNFFEDQVVHSLVLLLSWSANLKLN